MPLIIHQLLLEPALEAANDFMIPIIILLYAAELVNFISSLWKVHPM